MKSIFAAALVALSTPLAASAPTNDRDLHDYWDARCFSCHGHAAQFARKFLEVRDGKLLGRHHRDNLELFLQTHHLTPEYYAPTISMLKAQVEAAPLFKERCSGCHGTAAEFARKSLEMRNEVLHGKKSQEPVSEFLKNHFNPPAEEVRELVKQLTRVLGEVRTTAS